MLARFLGRILFMSVIVLASASARAQQPARPSAPPQPSAVATAAAQPAPQRDAPKDGPELKETTSVTKHTIAVGGQPVRYTATAGTLLLRDDKDKPIASFFYVYYAKDDVTDRSKRPIVYSFNGGPGTASVWMHMGFTGPRRVLYDDEGMMLQPPFRLVDNEYSILDVADIVYIDPVGTGYSKMAPGEDPHKFHGTLDDIRSVGDFIRLWTTRYQRWESPKFVIGESYGTTRASGVAGYLQQAHQLFLNGVILVSMTDLNVDSGTDLDYALVLPHYTATAWYHKALVPELQSKPLAEVLKQSEQYAMGAYLSALVKGDRIAAAERQEVAASVARLAGLTPEYVINSNLRVDRGRFRKELLRAKGVTVGRLDSRYTGHDRDAAGDEIEFDSALESWNGPFAATINQYFRNELNWQTDQKYNIWGDVRPWRRDEQANVGEMLRRAMAGNPYLKVLILEGYYDGATDPFTAEYTISHLDPSGELKGRFAFAFYESGHMMYVRKAALAKAKQDLAAFIALNVPKIGAGTQ
jgi:carboxypeptidase C (cathepsin A)